MAKPPIGTVVDVAIRCEATGEPHDMVDVTPLKLAGIELWVSCRDCGAEALLDCPPPPYVPQWLSR